jgi:methylmalonyl-CoA mutase C-terminal domain/subunit
MDQRIRVLVAQPGLDGHDRGAKAIAWVSRAAGMEAVYTGLRQTPEMIVNTALQEEVQAIGLSILSGAHHLLTEKRLGAAAVFQPGASLEGIMEFIRSSVPGQAGSVRA